MVSAKLPKAELEKKLDSVRVIAKHKVTPPEQGMYANRALLDAMRTHAAALREAGAKVTLKALVNDALAEYLTAHAKPAPATPIS